MHVVMTFVGGGSMDGRQEFKDTGRLKLDENIDVNLAVAQMIYDQTEKGQVGRFSQGFTRSVFRLFDREQIPDDITLTGYKYLIVKRTEDPIHKTISILAKYVPPT